MSTKGGRWTIDTSSKCCSIFDKRANIGYMNDNFPFKKAEEYANITGSQITVLVFSSAGNPYVHGSPSFDAVIDKFLSVNGGASSSG